MTVGDILTKMTYSPVPVDPVTARTFLAGLPQGSLAVVNLQGGAALASLKPADAAEIDAAARAARAALPVWAKADKRAALMALGAAVEKNAGLLAELACLESGRVIVECEKDVAFLADTLRYYAGADVADGAPYGVVAAIAHWSAPLAALARLVAPALVAGNAVLFKPEATTPLSALAFASLAQGILPDGVFHVVVGDRTLFAPLSAAVDMVSAALCVHGSAALCKAAVGKPLHIATQRRAPFVVCEEADLDAAASAAVALLRARTAGALLYVQESVAAEFFTRLRERISALRVGNALDRTSDVGPSRLVERLQAFIEKVQGEGAKLSYGGTAEGVFVAPTLIEDAEPSMESVRAAPMGPVLIATTFRTLKEAFALVGKAKGFAPATVFSAQIDPAFVAARGLDVSGVSLNAAGDERWLIDETAWYRRYGMPVTVSSEVMAGVDVSAAVAKAADAKPQALIAAITANGDDAVKAALPALLRLAAKLERLGPADMYAAPGVVGLVPAADVPVANVLMALAVVLAAGGRAVVSAEGGLYDSLKAVLPAAVPLVSGSALGLARHRGVDALFCGFGCADVLAAAAEDTKPVYFDVWCETGALSALSVKALRFSAKV